MIGNGVVAQCAACYLPRMSFSSGAPRCMFRSMALHICCGGGRGLRSINFTDCGITTTISGVLLQPW
eukprot:SAG11_NODE_1661_length_4497_cov_5.237608_4_plen_67_part_00